MARGVERDNLNVWRHTHHVTMCPRAPVWGSTEDDSAHAQRAAPDGKRDVGKERSSAEILPNVSSALQLPLQLRSHPARQCSAKGLFLDQLQRVMPAALTAAHTRAAPAAPQAAAAPPSAPGPGTRALPCQQRQPALGRPAWEQKAWAGGGLQ